MTSSQLNSTIEQIHSGCERQTLRRLSRTSAILFTIQPYFIPFVKTAKEPGIPGR